MTGKVWHLAIVALILGLVGVIWIGQGTRIIAGSAMTGSGFWGVAGVGVVIVAFVIIAVGRRPPTAN